jgi:hypothetical protein
MRSVAIANCCIKHGEGWQQYRGFLYMAAIRKHEFRLQASGRYACFQTFTCKSHQAAIRPWQPLGSIQPDDLDDRAFANIST